jgi:negative regulator of flagellin synthesis FlgM
MVDSIKNMNSRPDLHVKKDKSVAPVSAKSETPNNQKLAGVDTVEVGTKIGSAAVLELARAPQIDNEAVTRIKEAIAQGEYPVDVDRVTDALMDAYLELKG